MTVDITLRRGVKNRVYELVKLHGLAHSDFHWSTTNSEEVFGDTDVYLLSQLVYLPTFDFFTFGLDTVEYSPGEIRKVEWRRHEQQWSTKEDLLEQWLQRLREDAKPDLWASVGEPTTLTTAAVSPRLENRPFTESEVGDIVQALHQIETRLLSSIEEFQQGQTTLIRDGFQHLEEASSRIGRKDWILLFMGQMVSLFFTLGLSSANAQQILEFAGNALQFLWVSAQNYLTE